MTKNMTHKGKYTMLVDFGKSSTFYTELRELKKESNIEKMMAYLSIGQRVKKSLDYSIIKWQIKEHLLTSMRGFLHWLTKRNIQTRLF